MMYRNIDMNVSAEAKAMFEQVKKFSMEVMRPAGISLDKLSDPADVIAKERIQGGVPIFEHATIKHKLMKMFAMTEAARAGARRMAIYNLKNPVSPSVAHAVAAKCFSTETATFVASEAIQIFGGYGLAKEYPVEKMFRDARAGMIEDGCNDALAIKAAEFL
jgi:acyl-CoA dehydrogenase